MSEQTQQLLATLELVITTALQHTPQPPAVATDAVNALRDTFDKIDQLEQRVAALESA